MGKNCFAKDAYHLTFSEELEALLECPICFEPFEGAKFLPVCGHSFCNSCVVQLCERASQKSWGFHCPICGRIVNFDDVDARKISKTKKDNKKIGKKFAKKLPDSVAIQSLQNGCSIKTILTCQNCFRKLESPKTFPFCQHNFCGPCLVTILENSMTHFSKTEAKLKCPACSAKIKLIVEPGKEIPNSKSCILFFPTDYVVNSLLDCKEAL